MNIKKNVVPLMCLILIAIITIGAFVIYKYIDDNSIEIPEFDSINSIKFVPAKNKPQKFGDMPKELLFDLKEENHREIVNNILNWLKYGHVVGKSNGEYKSLTGAAAYLEIELKDGTSMQIKSAYINNIKETETVTQIESRSIDGQITIYISNRKDPVNEYSPELKLFIESGWKSIFDYTY